MTADSERALVKLPNGKLVIVPVSLADNPQAFIDGVGDEVEEVRRDHPEYDVWDEYALTPAELARSVERARKREVEEARRATRKARSRLIRWPVDVAKFLGILMFSALWAVFVGALTIAFLIALLLIDVLWGWGFSWNNP